MTTPTGQISFSDVSTELNPTPASTYSFPANTGNIILSGNYYGGDVIFVNDTTGISNGMLVTYVCNTAGGLIPGLTNNATYYVFTYSSWGPFTTQKNIRLGDPAQLGTIVSITGYPSVNNTSYLVPASNNNINVSTTDQYVRALANTINTSGYPRAGGEVQLSTSSTSGLQNKSRTKTISNTNINVNNSRTRSIEPGWQLPYANGTAWEIPKNYDYNYDYGISRYTWNWGSVDFDFFDTNVYENARIQSYDLTVTMRVEYSSQITDEGYTYFAMIPGIKPTGYPSTSFTDYGNQITRYLSEGTLISSGTYRVRDVVFNASLSKGVSLGSNGGWSISSNGQWNLNKIKNDRLIFALSARHAAFSNYYNYSGTEFRVQYISVSGKYEI